MIESAVPYTFAERFARGPNAKPLPEHVQEFIALPNEFTEDQFVHEGLQEHKDSGRSIFSELTRRCAIGDNAGALSLVGDLMYAVVNTDRARTLLEEMG